MSLTKAQVELIWEQHLEGDLEVCEDKLQLATQKLDKVNIQTVLPLNYGFFELQNCRLLQQETTATG